MSTAVYLWMDLDCRHVTATSTDFSLFATVLLTPWCPNATHTTTTHAKDTGAIGWIGVTRGWCGGLSRIQWQDDGPVGCRWLVVVVATVVVATVMATTM